MLCNYCRIGVLCAAVMTLLMLVDGGLGECQVTDVPLAEMDMDSPILEHLAPSPPGPHGVPSRMVPQPFLGR
jgi:hypothetical protein